MKKTARIQKTDTGKEWKSWVPFLFLLLFVSSCLSAPSSDTAVSNTDLPAFRRLATFPFDPTRPLDERTGDLPGPILQYLKDLDQTDAYRVHLPDPVEKKALKKSFDLMPPSMREELENRLVGVFFVDHFLTSGMTDWVLDEYGVLYPYIIIRTDVLNESATELIFRREKTAFSWPESPEYQFRIELSKNPSGLLYLLLHEGAHAMDMVWKITPFLEDTTRSFQEMENGPDPGGFVSGIWEDYRTPTAKSDFRKRDRISFYGFRNGPNLQASDIPEIYSSFSESPFVSLYGSLSWAEDLAEIFAFYHLGERMGNEYRIFIENQKTGEVLLLLEPLKRVAVRSRFSELERFYRLSVN